MKLKSILAACTLAMAGSAFAHGPAVVPDVQVFISGASAQQKTLGGIMTGMCQGGTLDVYYDTASNGVDYRAYFCTVTGTGTSLDGKKVLLHNRAKGGSVWGVNPVARSEAISRMAVNGTCVSTGGTNPSFKCPNTVNAIPDGGVSDVEPGIFVGSNVATGDSELTSAERGLLNVGSQNAVIFGIAATKKLYDALQFAQGLAVGNYTDDSARPSLSRAQLTSFLTGSYRDWSLLGVTPPANPVVKVCRRANGSGTQASANAWFLGYPCSSGGLAAATTADSDPGVYEVVENGSTGNVKTCLTTANTASQFAIGLLSLENTPVVADGWVHIKIDGIDPTRPNVIDGKYDYYVEQTMQWRNSQPAGNVLTFLETFRTRSGQPSVLNLLPGTAALPTIGTYGDNITMRGTRLNNTCQPAQLFF